jgi:hypothetical protein
MPRQRPAAVSDTPGQAGAQITPTAPVLADGDAIYPNNVVVVTTTTTACTLTFQTGQTAGNYAIADPTQVQPAGQTWIYGPWSKEFPQPSGTDAGLVYIDYSTVTGVTRYVLAT